MHIAVNLGGDPSALSQLRIRVDTDPPRRDLAAMAEFDLAAATRPAVLLATSAKLAILASATRNQTRPPLRRSADGSGHTNLLVENLDSPDRRLASSPRSKRCRRPSSSRRSGRSSRPSTRRRAPSLRRQSHRFSAAQASTVRVPNSRWPTTSPTKALNFSSSPIRVSYRHPLFSDACVDRPLPGRLSAVWATPNVKSDSQRAAMHRRAIAS